jgi:nitrous oxidase accessory protein NosD
MKERIPMKLATIFTVFVLLLFPFEIASAKKPDKNEIRLTADQVAGANDIEAAIIKATENGTHPGTVILDGKNGPFVFTAPDKSLNIFVSSLTVRGENEAAIMNCDDGLFFEGAPIHDILVEKITFNCTGDGVEATGEFHDVTLRKNNFQVAYYGIVTRGASTGWRITENRVQAGWDGIRMTGAKDTEITKNEITGINGVILLSGSQYQIKNNTIHAQIQGILLGQEAWQNVVQSNRITGVSLAGIALEPSITNNRVISNRVECASGVQCLAVDFPTIVVKSNKISGNSVR